MADPPPVNPVAQAQLTPAQYAWRQRQLNDQAAERNGRGPERKARGPVQDLLAYSQRQREFVRVFNKLRHSRLVKAAAWATGALMVVGGFSYGSAVAAGGAFGGVTVATLAICIMVPILSYKFGGIYPWIGKRVRGKGVERTVTYDGRDFTVEDDRFSHPQRQAGSRGHEAAPRERQGEPPTARMERSGVPPLPRPRPLPEQPRNKRKPGVDREAPTERRQVSGRTTSTARAVPPAPPARAVPPAHPGRGRGPGINLT